MSGVWWVVCDEWSVMSGEWCVMDGVWWMVCDEWSWGGDAGGGGGAAGAERKTRTPHSDVGNNTFQMLTIWVSKKSHLRLLPLGWHALPSWPGWVHEFSPLLEAPCILSEYFCGSISLKHFWQWKIAESLENPCLIDFNYIGQGSMFYEGVALSVGQCVPYPKCERKYL